MSVEDGFRRVLAARLPAGPAWAAWIDGAVTELAGSGITLTLEEARMAALALREYGAEPATLDYTDMDAMDALATRLEAS